MSFDKARETSRLKDKFIEQRKKVLASNVSALQKKVMTAILDRVIDKLDTEGKNIKNTNDNVSLVNEVDRIFKEAEREVLKLMKGVVNDYTLLYNYNVQYYTDFNTALEQSVMNTVKEQMNLRVGLTKKGDIAPNGFIDSFIKDKSVAQKVKQTVLSSVLNGTPIATLTKALNETVTGTDKAEGALQSHFRTYVYDTYSQYDRESNNGFAVQLALNYAVYEGGLVENSRPFCEDRNGKSFTREEVQAFGTPNDKFGGYTNKKQGEFQGKNKDYVPERDLGGYNCGHNLNWCSYNIAKRIRPDIPKSKFDNK